MVNICIRVLTMVDDFTRECLALVPDTSMSGHWVARELDLIIARRGKPKICVSDSGAEFTSMTILKWQKAGDVDRYYIQPGKPQQNAFIGGFKGRLRDDCLNETPLTSLGEVRAEWRTDYNRVRPHSSLANRTPEEFRPHHTALAAHSVGQWIIVKFDACAQSARAPHSVCALAC